VCQVRSLAFPVRSGPLGSLTRRETTGQQSKPRRGDERGDASTRDDTANVARLARTDTSPSIRPGSSLCHRSRSLAAFSDWADWLSLSRDAQARNRRRATQPTTNRRRAHTAIECADRDAHRSVVVPGRRRLARSLEVPHAAIARCDRASESINQRRRTRTSNEGGTASREGSNGHGDSPPSVKRNTTAL
jgi:hypothetical protein